MSAQMVEIYIAIGVGAFALGGSLVSIGAIVGKFENKFVTKKEYSEGCDILRKLNSKDDELLERRFIKMENQIEHKINVLEQKHNGIVDRIFTKIDSIFCQMEDMKVKLGKFEVSIDAQEKRTK